MQLSFFNAEKLFLKPLKKSVNLDITLKQISFQRKCCYLFDSVKILNLWFKEILKNAIKSKNR